MESYELLLKEDNSDNYKEFMLDKNDVISPKNVYKVNAMIRSNSSYNQSADVNALPILKNSKSIEDNMVDGNYDDKTTEADKESFKYLGSSAYWFSKLKHFIGNPETEVEISYKTSRNKTEGTNVSLAYVIYKTVCCVDNENSTHLNADNVGRNLLAHRLYNMGIDDLIKKLKEPQYAIIEELSKEINANEKGLFGKRKSNYHVSFASKWCHNACYYMLNDKCKDNFSKVDSVMKDALLIYENELWAKELDFDILKDNSKGKANKKIAQSYYKYIKIIDAVRKSGKSEISRNGLDCLLWYSYKK